MNRTVTLTHIPKTGGTSLRTRLTSSALADAVRALVPRDLQVIEYARRAFARGLRRRPSCVTPRTAWVYAV